MIYTLARLLAAFMVAQHFASPPGDLFDEADSDGSGALTFDEFRAVLPSLSLDAFEKVDTSGDGTVDEDEFEIGAKEGYFSDR